MSISPLGSSFAISKPADGPTRTRLAGGAGDANLDGVVDDQDALILSSHWQQSGATWAMGDFNGDYAVNDIDATIMAANWQSGASGAVPEPSAVVGLLGLCLAGLTASMRRN